MIDESIKDKKWALWGHAKAAAQKMPTNIDGPAQGFRRDIGRWSWREISSEYYDEEPSSLAHLQPEGSESLISCEALPRVTVLGWSSLAHLQPDHPGTDHPEDNQHNTDDAANHASSISSRANSLDDVDKCLLEESVANLCRDSAAECRYRKGQGMGPRARVQTRTSRTKISSMP